MTELTPLEQAVLTGSEAGRDKALAAQHKAEQDAAKVAGREAAAASKTRQQFNDQAAERIQAIGQQINGDIAALLQPLTDYAPSFKLPNKHALVRCTWATCSGKTTLTGNAKPWGKA